MSHDACSILHVLLESIHWIFLLLFFCFLLKYSDSATVRLPMSDMYIWSVSYIIFSCLIHVVLESTFLLKYSNSNIIRLPMSVMSHLIFSFILFFFVSQTYKYKGRWVGPTEFSQTNWIQSVLRASILEWSAGAPWLARIASCRSWLLDAPIMWPRKRTKVIAANLASRRRTMAVLASSSMQRPNQTTKLPFS